jgi:nucleoside-diphosphate-sugar epimerase
MRFAWGRVFHLYGPGEDGRRMVPALMDALLEGRRFPATEGTQLRDYLHADDVARGFVALLSDAARGTYNICSGEPVTVRALMERVAALAGRADLVAYGAQPARDWDPECLVGDNRRLRELGWAPSIALEVGLGAVLDERRRARGDR